MIGLKTIKMQNLLPPHSDLYKEDTKQTPRCKSCRYVDFNGQYCGLRISPFGNRPIKQDNWCRYWAPTDRHIPFVK